MRNEYGGENSGFEDDDAIFRVSSKRDENITDQMMFVFGDEVALGTAHLLVLRDMRPCVRPLFVLKKSGELIIRKIWKHHKLFG